MRQNERIENILKAQGHLSIWFKRIAERCNPISVLILARAAFPSSCSDIAFENAIANLGIKSVVCSVE